MQTKTKHATASHRNTPPGHDDSGNYMLNESLRFERFISDLSARFVNIAPDQVDGEIETALQQILEFFQVDRCGLLGLSPDRKKVHLIHGAFAEGIEQVSGDIDLANLFPWTYERAVLLGLPVRIDRMEELPERAGQDRSNCTAMGILSYLNIPLSIEGKVSSLIALNSVRRNRSWPEECIPRLRLLGEIFINALERRKAYGMLQEKEARLNLAAKAAGAMLWTLDIASGYIWTTEKAKEFFGFPADSELDLARFLNIVHSEDRDMLRRTIEEAVQSGNERAVEYRIVRSDGSIRWVLSRGRPAPAVLDNNVLLMGVSIDVTERKLREAAEIESMERYQAVVEAFDGFIYICSPDYRVEFMSQRLIERTGRNAVGETCYKVLHDRDSICEWCVNERVLQGETVRWEV